MGDAPASLLSDAMCDAPTLSDAQASLLIDAMCDAPASLLSDAMVDAPASLMSDAMGDAPASLLSDGCHFCRRRPADVVCRRCDATFCSEEHLQLLHDLTTGQLINNI
jgi:hypothetical protein